MKYISFDTNRYQVPPREITTLENVLHFQCLVQI